jgi:hypothetical protein
MIMAIGKENKFHHNKDFLNSISSFEKCNSACLTAIHLTNQPITQSTKQ